MDYDPDTTPDPASWLALDHADRIASASRAHAGRFPDALHTAGANELMHASLHAMIETQVASGEPALAGATVRRLHKDGLKRHAAIHAVLQVLAEHLGKMREDRPFDQGAYAAGLARLTAGDALGQALRGARFDGSGERRK